MSSKLYKTYTRLKIKSPYTKYLFKSGIFYLFLEDDARELHKILNLKLGHLNPYVVKCGFPVKSLEKYIRILKENGYGVEIVDLEKNTVLNYDTLIANNKISQLVEMLADLDVDSLSISEAFDILKNSREKSVDILKQIGAHV